MAAKSKKSAPSEKSAAAIRDMKHQQHQHNHHHQQQQQQQHHQQQQHYHHRQPSPPRTHIIKDDETLLIDPAIVAAENPDNRANQPYQGHQQYGHFQPARSISTSEYPNYSTAQPGPTQNVLSSPFLGSGGPVQHQPQVSTAETSFYNPHPSPRSTQSATGPYYPPDNKPDSMAVATAHMQRPYPPIYHTPQSASPASVSSPQTLDHGRPMYAHQQAPMAQQMYPQYGSYNQAQMNPMHQSAYGQHPSHPQYPQQVPTQSMASYQSNTPQMTNSQPPIHSANVSSSPRLKQESTQHYQQQPQQRTPLMPQSHVTSAPSQGSAGLPQSQPQSATQNSNAAPGPIPATTPLVVRRDGNGVQWISFEYSRDRVKMEYTIRCDVESVNTDTLNQEFKSENCVYPRACVPKEQYKGNRLNYETDCNQVGWSLAELNPCLRSKRGLIQRAVDSWRNSNQDQRLRSRRVRRQAKLNTRTKQAGQPVNQPTGQAGGISTGLPSQNSAQTYSTVPQSHQQIPSHQQIGSPTDLRQSQVFTGGYPSYPPAPSSLGPSMAPSMAGSLPPQFGRQTGNPMASSADQERDEEDSLLFGDLPENKRRKFLVVEDTQNHGRVRVKANLESIEMSEIPDSFRRQNAVYRRSYFPVQMPDEEVSGGDDRFVSVDADVGDGGRPTVGRVSVSIQSLEGGDESGEMDVPQLSRAKRGKEEKLNELGYRMAWGQSRAFAGRNIFLQKSLDTYRNKQRSMLVASGTEVDTIPAHLETRPGKRRWLDRNQSQGIVHTATPPPTTVTE